MLDDLGSREAVLVASSGTLATGALFAATHPSRTTALVVLEAYADPVAEDNYGMGPEETAAAMGTMWGTGEIAHLANPDMLWNEEIRAAWARQERLAASPATVALMFPLLIETDGVGSFARQPTRTLRRSAAGSYADEMRQIDFETEAQVLEFGLRRTPPPIEGQFEFGDECLHISRVRRERRTGEPLMITEAWLPADLAEVVTKDKVRQAPLYRVLSDVGIIVERMQHNITAEIAGPRYAQLLDTTIGSALLRIDRVAFVGDLPQSCCWRLTVLPMLRSRAGSRSHARR